MNFSGNSSKSSSKPFERQRMQSAQFTKRIKNMLFKGYERIKFVTDKSFNIKYFLKQKPEEEYLPSNEKYNIYYDSKFLHKYNDDSKNISFLLKNSLTPIKKGKKIKINKSTNKSCDFSPIYSKGKKNILNNQNENSLILKLDNGKSNINNSKKIFGVEEEKNLFSRYSMIYFDKMPDYIYSPNDLRNYPHYNAKYKQRNRAQEKFLFTISHKKEKNVKNIFRSLSPKITYKKYYIKEMINNSLKEDYKYNLFSISCSAKNRNNLKINKLIDSAKVKKFKNFLIKNKNINFFK